jgi:hypothetical protein
MGVQMHSSLPPTNLQWNMNSHTEPGTETTTITEAQQYQTFNM